MSLISLIAAIDEKRGLGKNNQLLFKIPADLKRFKEITLGHAVVMGRKTFEAIGRPLPHRMNIVITRDKNYQADGCMVVNSLDEALERARQVEREEIFIIGGGEIYKQIIDQADKLYLTMVKGVFEADTFFPDYSKFTKILSQEKLEDVTYSATLFELTK